MNTVLISDVPGAYRVIGPDGASIPVTKEMFEALQDMGQRRHSGSVTISFNSGRIAGVKMAIEKVYK